MSEKVKETKKKKSGKIKKTFKIIGIIIFILLIVFAINLIRKTIIIQKIERASHIYDEETNYYKNRKSFVNGQEETTDEMFRKDNIYVYKNHTSNGTAMLFEDYSSNTGWLISNKQNEKGEIVKVAVKTNKDTIVPKVNSGVFTGSDNFFKCMQVALYMGISSDKVNGKDCYKVYLLDGNWKLFFNKENLLIEKEVTGNVTMVTLESSFKTVTDDDVKLPDLTDYEIKEIN